MPVLALQISSNQLTGSQLYDMASNLIRPMLVSVPGVAVPAPYGGTPANVQVDLDQQKLLARGLSAQDVAHALGQQNIVLPAGDQKIGALDFLVETNASPVNVDTFNALPIKQVHGAVVTVGDVAHVYVGGPPQTNSVLVHGQQAVLLEILKAGDASTLAVVAGVKGQNTRDSADLARRRENHCPERCIDLRARFGGRCRARDGDGGRVDRPDRSAVSRVGALDAYRRHVHPALDPVLDPGTHLVRPDHQRHDAGRPGARGRHPGG